MFTQERLDELFEAMDAEILDELRTGMSPCAPHLLVALYVLMDKRWTEDTPLTNEEATALDPWFAVADAYLRLTFKYKKGSDINFLNQEYAQAMVRVCRGSADQIFLFVSQRPNAFPEAIIDEFGEATDPAKSCRDGLVSSNRTSAELARAVAGRCGCNPETVLRFLRGTHDTTTRVLGAIMDELELEIVPR